MASDPMGLSFGDVNHDGLVDVFISSSNFPESFHETTSGKIVSKGRTYANGLLINKYVFLQRFGWAGIADLNAMGRMNAGFSLTV